MAESLQSKFEKHLTCSVCLEQLKDPKVLPCLHSYCHVCIVNLTRNSKSNAINCPDCRLAVKVDENTVSTLPTNFFVKNLQATMSLTNDTLSEKILCESCKNEDAAQTRCNECGVFLCQFCTEFHKRSKSMSLHKLLTMEELKSSAGPQNIAEKVKCAKHKKKVIKLFCKTCQTTICRDCVIVDHRQHDYGFVEEVAVEEKQFLQRNLDEVKQRKAKVVEGIANLKNFNESLDAKKKSTIAEINAHFDELAKAIESQKKEMVEKATSLTDSKQKQIYAQIEALEVALASCESSIDFTERAFKNGNDVQILSMEKYILQSLEQLKTVKDQTKPCVTKDMMFVISSSVKETKETLSTGYDVDIAVASPGNCKASFNEVDKLVFNAGKQYSITLMCRDENNRRLRYGGQDIKPSFSGMEVSDITVTDNEDGSYIISFCPHQGGMLKFEVSINGTPAPNCCLTQQVKWVISDVYGRGVITDDGKTMKGDGCEGEYSCRVGGCYFESGVHSWKVQLSRYFDGYYDKGYSGEVGIIACDEINENIANSKKKWAYNSYFSNQFYPIISLTLDMDKKTLNVQAKNYGSSDAQNYQFTARRVSPYFACNSPSATLAIVE